MSGSDPKIRVPRHTAPANRALEEHEVLRKRQSDHEHTVDTHMAAIATHLARRESFERVTAEQRTAFERDAAIAIALLAREMGVGDRLPAGLRRSLPPPPPPPAPGTTAPSPRVPVHVNARKSAQAAQSAAQSGARATALGVVILLCQLLLEALRHIP